MISSLKLEVSAYPLWSCGFCSARMSPGGVGWEQGGPEPSHWETGCRAGGVPGLSSEGPPDRQGRVTQQRTPGKQPCRLPGTPRLISLLTQSRSPFSKPLFMFYPSVLHKSDPHQTPWLLRVTNQKIA